MLDGTTELVGDPDSQNKLIEDTWQLGLVVCHGTSVLLISLHNGMEAVPKPFTQQQNI